MEAIVGLVIAWFLFGIGSAACCVMDENKGRSIGSWSILAFLLGPFGLILAFVVSKNQEANEKESIQTTDTTPFEVTPNGDGIGRSLAKIDELTEAAKEHLDMGEEIVAVVEGVISTVVQSEVSLFTVGGLGGTPIEKDMNSRNGIFIATSKRIVLYRRKRSGYELEVFPYSNISSIEMDKKWDGYRVAFSGSGKMRMTGIETGDVQKFVEYVRSRMGQMEEETTPSELTMDIPDQIRKLAELKDQGILTEEEFESKKKELLAKL